MWSSTNFDNFNQHILRRVCFYYVNLISIVKTTFFEGRGRQVLASKYYVNKTQFRQFDYKL